MLLMIEKGIRGGISMIAKRYEEANNEYMKSYDSDLPTKHIIYLDANNLYGWAMLEPLAIRGFQWMSDSEIGEAWDAELRDRRSCEVLQNWINHPCILKVDLEYPKELHDKHNGYPLAPENLIIGGVEKLIPNLRNREKCVIHHKALKQCEALGLQITKIHRGLKFEEYAWLKPYIDLNARLRAEATNDFEKDFFKLMHNSVFGKTMENIRNRVDIRLVTNEKQARKLISKSNYQHHTIFCENLSAFHM